MLAHGHMRAGVVILLAGVLGTVLWATTASYAQTNSHTFPQTGHTVQGLFWDYWQGHGGLAQQGYPISDEIQERSDLNGQTYTVQYFERAVFEAHPENQAPYNVLLSQLGTFRYRAKYPQGAPNQQASTSNPRYFPTTRHTVGGAFRAYWETHGGLAQQGYPISDEFTEISDLNGRPYTVQYFERAVFEKHPENQPPYDVLLSQLGTFRYRAKYQPAQATPTPGAVAQATPTPPGKTNCEAVSADKKAPIAHSGSIAIADVHFLEPEFVVIANTGGAAVSLAGWQLRDKNETSQRYTFPAGTALAGGASLQVYTEPGHPYSFNRHEGIWNDCGDALELRDAAGTVVATYGYGTHASTRQDLAG